MDIQITELAAHDVVSAQKQIVQIYAAAFGLPPYNKQADEVATFTETLGRHSQRKGFRCFVAREQAKIVGFAYGYTGVPGQWWHDLVVQSMDREMVRQWMTDVFEVAELAVEPGRHGHGIGGRLHDRLLQGLSHRTAVLSTYQEETVAVKLYEKRGWINLVEHFMFPGYIAPYRIMGKALHDPARQGHGKGIMGVTDGA